MIIPGTKSWQITPFAQVADNDLAVGMFVDYLSHSPVWKESLVMIVEDDAQNGPDHVDAHRSTAYIAGGYVKKVLLIILPILQRPASYNRAYPWTPTHESI